MKRLTVKAGREAFTLIRKNGFDPEFIKGVVSAAGGPKWFSIYGLTRYLISDLLSQVSGHVHLLGSSVGAWQMTAACTRDPGLAIKRLRDAYANHEYSDTPDAREISLACRSVIESMLGDNIDYVLNNPKRGLQVVTTRGRGGLLGQNKWTLVPGLALTAMANAVGRKYMRWPVRRTIFTTCQDLMYETRIDELPTDQVPLNKENLVDALHASGAIPLMMIGIPQIAAGTPGVYWDGGITDYHISLPFKGPDGIVLHPHFDPIVKPGWFDKKLPWTRKASADNMSKILLLHPSQEFIRSLPYGRITEMKDFHRFRDNQNERIAYWNEVSERSNELAEELHELIQSGQLTSRMTLYE